MADLTSDDSAPRPKLRVKSWVAGHPEPTVAEPTVDELADMANDSSAEATDGCWVEQDGTCEHGHPSWLIRMGLI